MKIAVCLHLFYTDMWEEMISYIDNIKVPFKLYVNLVHGFYTPEIVDTIKEYREDAVITFSHNKGVDIGGFLNSYSVVDGDTDLILKIHTKKSIGLPDKPSDMVRVYGLESAKQKGSEWFIRNMGGLLKNPEQINNIIERFKNDETCGMVGHNLETYVGPNEFLVKELIQIFKLNSDVINSNFIDGTMFWVRNDILSKYLTLDLINLLLKMIPKGYHNEPSINHSLERIFGYIIKNENKEVVVI